MDVHELIFHGHTILRPACLLLASVALLVKSGVGAGGKVAGVALGLLGLVAAFYGLLRHGKIEPRFFDEDSHVALQIVSLTGWVVVVVGLFLIPPRKRSPAPVVERAPDRGAPLPRPTWGLASAWIACSAAGFLLSILLLAMYAEALPRVTNREMREMTPVIVLVALATLATTILYCTWLYTAWKAVPREHRSTSPGCAVGFLFIPFFNLYWVFRAVPGLSSSIQRAQAAVDPRRADGAGFGVGVAAAIVSVIPYVNVLSWILFLIWVCVVNAAKNRMQRLLAGPVPGESEEPW